MEMIVEFIQENYVAVILASAFLVAGGIMEMFVFPKIRKYVIQKDPKGGKVIMASVRGISFTVAAGIGILILLNRLEMQAPYGVYIKNGLWVLLVLLVTWLIARIIGSVINHTTDRDNSEFTGATIFENVFKIVTYSLGVLVAMQVVGIPIAPIITALGVGGLAVALALQDTLSNLFSGLSIIASRKIRPGDFIKLQSGEEGFVEDINWRTTTIRETAENIIVIPNSKLAGAIHKNFNLPDIEVLVSIIGVADFEADFALIEQLALKAALDAQSKLDFCIKSHAPLFRWQQFNDTGMQFAIVLKISDYSMLGLLRHEVLKRYLELCKENKVRMPRPYFSAD